MYIYIHEVPQGAGEFGWFIGPKLGIGREKIQRHQPVRSSGLVHIYIILLYSSSIVRLTIKLSHVCAVPDLKKLNNTFSGLVLAKKQYKF